jgi:hypothetical protein
MGVQLAAFRAGNVAAAKASEIPLSNALVAEAAHANSPSAALNRDILQFCLDENNVAWYGYLYLVTNNNVYYVRGGRYTAAFAVALKAAVSIVKQHQ